jgi:hypothetical protein
MRFITGCGLSLEELDFDKISMQVFEQISNKKQL